MSIGFRILLSLLISNLTISAIASADVAINWTQSKDPRAIGYLLEYSSEESQSELLDVGHLNYKVLSDLEPNKKYSFRVKAYDYYGNESKYTSKVEVLTIGRDSGDTDTDRDGLLDKYELSVGTNPLSNDTDQDGVSDYVEILEDKTDPKERGSNRARLGREICTNWNGYLGGMTNIIENTNLGTNHLDVTLEVYSSSGELKNSTYYSLPPNGKRDIILDQSTGWNYDEYGTACLKHNGNPGDLDGQMVHYLEEENRPSKYEFALAMPFDPGVVGKNHVGFNTFQPSTRASDAANPSLNWIQISNLEDRTQSGNLVFYDSEGNKRLDVNLILGPKQRMDVTPNQVGPNVFGLAEWSPDNSSARFQMRNIRYYFDNTDLRNSFDDATQQRGKAGSGSPVLSPYNSTNSTAILEVSNTIAKPTGAEVKIFDLNGNLLNKLFLTL